MSSNTVIEKINEKAEQDAALIWENGRKQALALESNILENAEKEKTLILFNAQKECESILKTAQLNATLQARKNTLEEKQSLISDVFCDALNILDDLDDEKLKAFINKLVLNECMSGKVTLLVSSDNINKYKKLFNDKCLLDWSKAMSNKYGCPCSLSLEASDFRHGGIIFVGDKWDVDCRFDSIISTIKEEEISNVSKILFG